MVTFTEEILNAKLHFLCSVSDMKWNNVYNNFGVRVQVIS